MESIEKKIIEEKIENNRYDGRDFFVSGEIMVTITLAEYRKLIDDNATNRQRLNEAISRKYESEAEKEKLEYEVEVLKAELHELHELQKKTVFMENKNGYITAEEIMEGIKKKEDER